MKAQVAVIGPATRDRVVLCGVDRRKWGGVVVYSGLTFSRLGISTGVMTNLAARDHSVVDLLTKAGIAVEVGDSEATTEFVNHVTGDERRQELLARGTPISASQLTGIAASVDHFYLGPLHPLDIEPEAMKVLRGVDRVSADIQGYTRKLEGTEVLPGVSPHVRLALEQADFVTASRHETEAVVNFCEREVGALMEEFRIEQWLTTDGKRGGCLQNRAGKRYDFRAANVDKVVDPTGAGDVFFAAYLTYHLYEGADIDEALRQAAAVTARQVEGRFITAEELSRERD